MGVTQMNHAPFDFSQTQPLHIAPRIHFQRYYVNQVPKRPDNVRDIPNILNIGCSDDPLKLGDYGWHFDMDDWSQRFKWFTQGDAHKLPFQDNEFHTVLLGDVLEHVLHPPIVIEEALRVCSHSVVLTIFEEWRLGEGFGRFIEEGQAASDVDSQALGYADREDAQVQLFSDRVGVDDTEHPHLSHIWQFPDWYIYEVFRGLVLRNLCTFGYFEKRFEVTYLRGKPDEHNIYNWLVCLEKVHE